MKNDVWHPGITLRLHFLEPNGMQPEQAAKMFGYDMDTMNRILDGTKPIDSDFAERFNKAWKGNNSAYWLRLQKAYDDMLKNDNLMNL